MARGPNFFAGGGIFPVTLVKFAICMPFLVVITVNMNNAGAFEEKPDLFGDVAG